MKPAEINGASLCYTHSCVLCVLLTLAVIVAITAAFAAVAQLLGCFRSLRDSYFGGESSLVSFRIYFAVLSIQ